MRVRQRPADRPADHHAPSGWTGWRPRPPRSWRSAPAPRTAASTRWPATRPARWACPTTWAGTGGPRPACRSSACPAARPSRTTSPRPSSTCSTRWPARRRTIPLDEALRPRWLFEVDRAHRLRPGLLLRPERVRDRLRLDRPAWSRWAAGGRWCGATWPSAAGSTGSAAARTSAASASPAPCPAFRTSSCRSWRRRGGGPGGGGAGYARHGPHAARLHAAQAADAGFAAVTREVGMSAAPDARAAAGRVEPAAGAVALRARPARGHGRRGAGPAAWCSSTARGWSGSWRLSARSTAVRPGRRPAGGEPAAGARPAPAPPGRPGPASPRPGTGRIGRRRGGVPRHRQRWRRAAPHRAAAGAAPPGRCEQAITTAVRDAAPETTGVEFDVAAAPPMLLQISRRPPAPAGRSDAGP